MITDDEPITVVTGMAEDKYEYLWKIQNLMMVQKDDVLLEDQKFEINTGKGSPLQAKWVVGFKNIADQKTYYTIYCKLKELYSFSETGIEELVSHLTVKLKQTNGSIAWTSEQQGRIKVGDEFDLYQGGRYCWNQSQNWNGYQDSFGAVTFHIKLSLLKPLTSGCSICDVDALEEQFRMKSVRMAERNLACFMISDSSEFDVKIVCGDGKEIKAHKSILASNSPVFQTMLQADLSEAKTGVVKVDDLSGKTVEVLLQYLYTGKLSKSWREPGIIVEFTYAAGKYELTELCEHLNDMLGNTNEDPTTVLALLELAHKMSLEKAESRLMDRIVKLTISAKSGGDMLSLFGNGT